MNIVFKRNFLNDRSVSAIRRILLYIAPKSVIKAKYFDIFTLPHYSTMSIKKNNAFSEFEILTEQILSADKTFA